MAKFTTLKDRTTGGTLYPRTLAEAVSCGDGKSVGSHIERLKRVNICSAEPLTPGNFPDVGVYTREQLKMDLFIDLWNSCAESDGRYNEATGYFELNGLTDITYEEALAIYAHSLQYTYSRISDRNAGDSYNTGDCRTYFRIRVYNGHLDFAYNHKLEVLNLKHARLRLLNLYLCPAIRRIIGDPIDTGGGLTKISGAPALEEVRIRLSSGPLDLRELAMLSPESLLYMATNRYESATEPIAVTLHPEAYARLTDDIVAAAAERLITFVTPD